MFEESDFVTPPQDVEETADAAQADTVQTSETDQAQNCEAQTDEDHIKGTEGASQYRYSYIKNHQWNQMHRFSCCRSLCSVLQH